MRFVLAVAALGPVLALPIPRQQQDASCAEHSLEIIQYNSEASYIQILLPAGLDRADESLVIDLGLPQCNNDITACESLLVAGQHIPSDVQLPTNHSQATSASETTVTITSTSGLHLADITLTTVIRKLEHFTEVEADTHVRRLDAEPSDAGHIIARWTQRPGHALTLSSLHRISPHAESEEWQLRCPIQSAMASDSTAEEEYIAQELESLRLLEQKAFELQQEITLRKQVTSVMMAEHRSQKPLQQLIDECDGVVCAAKQIATRVYDRINLATLDRSQMPIAGSDMKSEFIKVSSMELPEHLATGHNITSTTDISPGFFTRAFAIIAGIFGLSILILYIKRKCMSMRNRVERAADREERRNARAYRRAARRAEMCRRWSNFMKSLNCFKPKELPRMTDYDEKRALIIQDALLEEDYSQLEKGDIMEAEIRQLRNAQEIVANIILGREEKTPMRKDPPPSLVPLPGSPARSRASTSTLPSYNSEDLPDYSSIPEPTGENTTTDGFAHYRPTSFDHHYTVRASASLSSGRTRSTPISSVPALSPRVSAETLCTRFSRGGSFTSRS